MIEFKINDKHDIERLVVTGDLEAICADVSIMVSAIYNACRRADVSGEVASKFRMLMAVGLASPFSPVWDEAEVDGAFIIAKKEFGK